LSSEKHKEGISYVPYNIIPLNIDSETWAEIQRKWIDVDREKIKALVDVAKEIVNGLKDYYLKKVHKVTLPSYILIAIVVIVATILTGLGKVSGETFAFLMGTIVGYIISLLSKHM